MLVLGCIECARINIHGGKLVDQDNTQFKDRVGLRMKSTITRGGNTIDSDVKDRLDVPSHDQLSSNMTDVGTSPCLTNLVGIFKGSVLEGERGISRLLQHYLSLAHVVLGQYIQPVAISMIDGPMSNSTGIPRMQ